MTLEEYKQVKQKEQEAMILEEYKQMTNHRSIVDSIIEEVAKILTTKTSKEVTNNGFKQETQQEDQQIMTLKISGEIHVCK